MTTSRAAGERFAPLIGRVELVDALAADRVVMLVAQPGAGKSRMLAELRAVASEPVVVTVRCHRGVVSTYEPLEALLASAARQLKGGARATPARAPIDDADRLVVLRERLEAVAERAPILLQIDDLHWAPRAALEAIAFCIDRTRDSALRWQLATRPIAESPDPLDALRREPDCRIVDLPLLDAEQTAEMTRLLGGSPEPDLHRLTGGNPLYVEQLLLARSRPGSASTLRATLDARARDIPPRATGIAALAALAERPLTLTELDEVAGESPRAVRSIVDDLAALGIFRIEDTGVEFVHDLLRDACAGLLDDERRAALHSTLVKLARNDVERARHLAAARRGDEAQTAYLAAARTAIYDFAFAEVREIVAKLEALPGLTPGTFWQLSAIEAILHTVKHGLSQDRAKIDALLAARSCVDSATAAFFIRYMLAVSGTPTEGIGPLVIDAMIAAPDIATADKAAFYRHRAIILYSKGDFAESAAMIDTVLATGEVKENAAFELRCMRALCRAPLAIDEARAELVALASDPANAALASFDFVYLVLGQLADAIDDNEARIHWAQCGLACRGRIRESFYLLWATGSLWQGDLSKALDVCEAFLGWAQSRGMPHNPWPLTLHVEAYAWAEQFERARDLLIASGLADDPRLTYARAMLAEHEGRTDEALALFAKVAGGYAYGEREYELRAIAALVRIRALAGDVEGARTAYERLASEMPSEASRKERAESAFYLALAAGDADAARRRIAAFGEAHVPILRRAVALSYLGERFRDREALFDATAIFDRSGAKGYRERTRRIAREQGFRFGSTSTRNVLSDREAGIARLIAAGRTNREIAEALHVSPKTVAANIGTMLERYGLRSRVEIAAQMASGKPFERVSR